jgi:hypothetical protein
VLLSSFAPSLALCAAVLAGGCATGSADGTGRKPASGRDPLVAPPPGPGAEAPSPSCKARAGSGDGPCFGSVDEACRALACAPPKGCGLGYSSPPVVMCVPASEAYEK